MLTLQTLEVSRGLAAAAAGLVAALMMIRVALMNGGVVERHSPHVCPSCGRVHRGRVCPWCTRR